jgi:hypothetical protein
MNKSPPNKEILILLREIRDDQIFQNRADRQNTLERQQNVFYGRLERLEQRMKFLEEHLEIEFINEAKYQKK